MTSIVGCEDSLKYQFRLSSASSVIRTRLGSVSRGRRGSAIDLNRRLTKQQLARSNNSSCSSLSIWTMSSVGRDRR